MPESKPHLDENCFVILDEADVTDPDRPPHLSVEAIVACGMCDDDGYRNGVICDHQDHTAAARRGMAKCRAALAPKSAPQPAQPQESTSGATS